MAISAEAVSRVGSKFAERRAQQTGINRQGKFMPDTKSVRRTEDYLINDSDISDLLKKTRSAQQDIRNRTDTKLFTGESFANAAPVLTKKNGTHNYISEANAEYNNYRNQLDELLRRKNSKVSADDLLAYYNNEQNNEIAKQVSDDFNKMAQKHPIIAEGARVVSSPIAATANIVQTIEDTIGKGNHAYGALNMLPDARMGIKQGEEQHAADFAQEKNLPFADKDINIFGKNFGNVYKNIYDAVDMAAENVYTSLIFGGNLTSGIKAKGLSEKALQGAITGTVTSASMGENVSSLKAQGIDLKSVYAQAGKDAIIEFASEMLGTPLEKLNGVLPTVASEALEEVIGNAISNIDDVVRLQDEGEILQTYNYFISQGLSEKQALGLTVKDLLADDIFSAGMAAVSALGMAAPQNIVSTAVQNSQYKSAGNAILDEQKNSVKGDEILDDNRRAGQGEQTRFTGLIDTALAVSENDKNVAKTLKNTYDDSKSIGRLHYAVEQYFDDTLSKAETADDLKSSYDSLMKQSKGIYALDLTEMYKQKQSVLGYAQKNITVESNSDVKHSKKLGRYADVNVNVDNELSSYGIKNTANSLNDFVGVQKSVLNQLKAENFFNENNRNITVNADTNVVVELGPQGIKETLSSGNRYETLPRKIKEAKLATIRSLPEMIKYAEVKELNQANYHNKQNSKFLVLEHPCTVGNDSFDVEIKIEKTPQNNKFYIHNINIKKHISLVDTLAENSTRPHKSYDVSNTNISQNKIDVKKKAEFEAVKNSQFTGVKSLGTVKDKTQKAEIELIDGFAKDKGLSVIIVDSVEEINGENANAMAENGKIVIGLDTDNGMLLPYAGHELFHILKQNKGSSKTADELQNFIIDTLKNNSSYGYEERFNALQKKYGTNNADVINEEIAANACFTVLSDELNFTQLVQQNRSLAQRVRDFFAEFVEKIKSRLVNLAKLNPEYKALQNDLTAQQKIVDMMNTALNEYQGNSNDINDGVAKFSNKDSFDKQLDSWDMKTVGFSFVAGNTQGVLENVEYMPGQKIGKKQIRIDATKLQNILNKHNGMNIDVVKQIPNILDNPIVIVKSNTQNGRVVVLGDVYDANNKLVMVALELNPISRSGKTTYTDIIKVATAQGRSHIQSLLKNEILYLDNNKKRVNQWLNVNRLQLPLHSTTDNSNINVSQNDTDVNNNSMQNDSKYSFRDSEGNKLTAEQQEYFKDSKVRDENGNLLVMYHGSPNEFTIFDRNKIGSTTDKNSRSGVWGKGFYFSSKERVSASYTGSGSNLKAYYLNINNPFIIKSNDDIDKFNSYYLKYADMTEADYDKYFENPFKFYEEAYTKGTQELITSGYDGVISKLDNDYEIVIFDSKQAKLIDNLNPTSNQDIRFSLKENVEQTKDLIAVHNLHETDLEKAFTLGGMPMPSIAIVKAQQGHNVYGEISLIADKSTIDPEADKNNKVYGGDAYTPTYPTVEYELNDKNAEAIYKKANALAKMPTGYFEAKLQRAVHMEEWRAALVPKNCSSDLKQRLSDYGIEVVEYNGTNEDRVKKLNSINNIRFSKRDSIDVDEFDESGYDYLQEGRKSLRETDEDYKKLLEENAYLQEANELLQQELQLTEGHRLNQKQINTTVNKLIENHGAYGVNKDLLTNKLVGLYSYIANAGADIDSDYVWNTANDIGKIIADASSVKVTSFYDEYKPLKKRIRETVLYVPSDVKKEVSAYTNLNRFRIRTTKGAGIELESFYNDLSSNYPELFDSDTVSEADRLSKITEVYESIAPIYSDRVSQLGYSSEEYTSIIALEVFDRYFDVKEVHIFADKKQKEIDLLRAHYRNTIDDMKQSYKARYKAREQELYDRIKRTRQNGNEKLIKQKAHFQEVSKAGSERRKRSAIKASIRKSLRKLVYLGAKPDKKKHIPNSIVDSVKILAQSIILEDTKQDILIKNKLSEFQNGFEQIKDNSQYSVISELYNSYINNKIIDLKNKIGNTTLNNLSTDTLQEIDDIIKMTVQSINNVNRLFGKIRTDTIDNLVNKISAELAPYKKDTIYKGRLKSFVFNSMKPEYFFEYLGSKTFKGLADDLRKGEDIWAVDISEAKAYADKIRRKYNYKNWDDKTVKKFKTLYGDIELTLQERLAIYANSLGEHTRNHLEGCGFKYYQSEETVWNRIKHHFKVKNDVSNHRLSEADILKIASSLTDEQQNYVKDMIKYLSEVMGEKGNRVSRELYGVELFKEKMYYPAKVDENSTEKNNKPMEVKAGKKIKNAGFTNSTVKNAKNPIVLMDFDDVWASHIDEMSKYHAFALALENIDRVFNYHTVDSSNNSFSMRDAIRKSFGDEANKYIDNLLNDINGNSVQGAGTGIASSLISKFKKNAVFASASVAIQQPSAIGRALSEIDAAYFLKTTRTGFSRSSYEEMKEYAPVAIIKEMGYFDTNMAKSTVDYLNAAQYDGVAEKVRAFFKDGSYRDEAMSFFASKADEITWTHIWNAVKEETKAKHKNLSKENMLKIAGERFTEVITKTQVYDSVFSRSGFMRSKDLLMKSATAFMAEPTTSLNMFFNAAVQTKRGNMSKAKGARVFGALVTASVINSFLQSIVTAARADDDDDKKWAEVYLAQLLPNFIDNLNSFNQIIFIRDIINIFKGYDVERADMNLFTNLADAFKKMKSDKVSDTDKFMGLAGAVSAFFGLPVKNVYRDFKAVLNIKNDFVKNKKFSKNNATEIFKEELNSCFGITLFKEDLDKAISAVEEGNTDEYDKYADKVYASDDAYDLLYAVYYQYGENSSEYRKAKEQCIRIKKENGAKNPNPDNSMKNKKKKELKKYAEFKNGKNYIKAEKARKRCIQLYGSMDKVNKALKELEEENSSED